MRATGILAEITEGKKSGRFRHMQWPCRKGEGSAPAFGANAEFFPAVARTLVRNGSTMMAGLAQNDKIPPH
jgi:hypothetical protein